MNIRFDNTGWSDFGIGVHVFRYTYAKETCISFQFLILEVDFVFTQKEGVSGSSK